MANPEARLLDVTLLCDTTAYAANDLLVATQKIPNAMRDIDFPAVLQTITIIDEDNQGAAMDIYFLDANVNFGRFNQLPTLSGVGARSIMARLGIATTDWKTINNVRVATFGSSKYATKTSSGYNRYLCSNSEWSGNSNIFSRRF